MSEDRTPYRIMEDAWAKWIEKKIDELKLEASIARVSEKRGGKGHLRSSGQYVTARELKDEVKLMEHLLSHCHIGEFCDERSAGVY